MSSDAYTAPEIGTIFHWIADGLTYSRDRSRPLSGVLSHRGQSETVTEAFIAATTDKNGFCWLSLIADEEVQLARWGAVYMRPGTAPQALVEHPWPQGSAEASYERSVRVEAAWKLPTARQRNAELREISKVFGPVPTSKSSVTYRYYNEEA